MLRPSERTRIRRAFRAIKDAGGMTYTGTCCPHCSINALRDQGADQDTIIAIYHVQEAAEAFAHGRMVQPLHIYHGASDGRFVCQALEAEGLRVEWTGNNEDEITVLPDLLH